MQLKAILQQVLGRGRLPAATNASQRSQSLVSSRNQPVGAELSANARRSISHVPVHQPPSATDGRQGPQQRKFSAQSLALEDVEDSQDIMESVLRLEEIGKNHFRNTSQFNPASLPKLFGGQVTSQALLAARNSLAVPSEAHSIHGHFLRPGDFKIPTDYHVTSLKEGRTFQSCSVVASQNGQPIYMGIASFSSEWDSSDLNHQVERPSLQTNPETLPTHSESVCQIIKKGLPGVPKEMQKRLQYVISEINRLPFPLDVRVENPRDIFRPTPDGSSLRLWLRSHSPLKDDLLFHQSVAAYASDWTLGATALRHTDVEYPSPFVKKLASLDHTIWFHAPLRVDDWLLYELQSPVSAGSRSLNIGKLYTREGQLVMTVAQESLLVLDQNRHMHSKRTAA